MPSFQKYFPVVLLSLLAAQTNATGAGNTFAGVVNQYPYEFYALLGLNILELIIIWMLAKALLHSLGYKQEETKVKPKIPVARGRGIMQRIMESMISSGGDEIDLKHDYDGISELDNKTPQWWSVAFYLTILFGVIYTYRMFISETMPGQLTELNAEIATAKKTRLNQLTTVNDKIDENSVVLLDDENKFKGGLIFSANCVPCHGQNGEGNVVGPNLTDDYWLHKGGIKDIFTSIKYGYIEKGMKSWTNDFSPLQLAQLATYVKSLRGSNPPNAKAMQGELYIDSTAIRKDSLVIPDKKG